MRARVRARASARARARDSAPNRAADRARACDYDRLVPVTTATGPMAMLAPVVPLAETGRP